MGTHTLSDVAYGSIGMDKFISELTDDDLTCIIRGEGMGSSLVTPGTAAAFGGESLRSAAVMDRPVCG